MNGLTVCGGWEGNRENVNTIDDCKTLGLGGWETSHTLIQGRVKHVSWKSDEDILLMGGLSSTYDQINTTEVAEKDGSVADSPFWLKYELG